MHDPHKVKGQPVTDLRGIKRRVMSIPLILFGSTCALALLFWFAGVLVFFKTPRLDRAPRNLEDRVRLSLVIPARNEETRIGALLESINAQSLAPDEVIIIDDESADATAEVAARAGFAARPAPPRPAGWTGKSWACFYGAKQATGDILVFVDADVRLSADALERLAVTHKRMGGAISVQPYHRIKRGYENLSAFFNAVVMAGLDSFSLFSRQGKPAGCFGPCIMVSRDDYFRCGGHDAVRNELVDDVALGKLFLENGITVNNFAGKGCVEFSMYPEGPASLIEGWTKNIARASAMSRRLQVVLLAFWITGTMAAIFTPLFLLPVISPLTAALAATVSTLHAVQYGRVFRQIGNFSFFTALFFAVPVVFFLIIFFRSIVLTYGKKKVSWKGREINLR